ncbi:MAG: glycosyltransferase family 1 protein [Betaproteobacteria bacterium]|nr:glycosyltransferase family 1 protein [Betaproteobacteria bacterium]
MAAILYAWEFGANLGHIGTFLPIAKELRNHGAKVHWVVTHPHQAARLLPKAGFDWLQAPTMPEQRREGPPLSYADILLRFGYADDTDLLGLVVAWRELLRLTAASVVLADHSPTAILAARTLDIPVMLFGSGFFAPPQVHPTPNMRPWSPVPAEQLLAMDRMALKSINAALEGYGKPKLDILAQLFQVAEDSLLSFPELDHYPARGPARYWGMLPAAVAADSTWPAAAGPRVFSYLRPETPHLESALQALHGLRGSVLIYAPGLTAELMQRYSAPHVAFSSVPVDLNKVARQADAGLTYASPAATVAFLMAGKPVLMIPGHLEQFLFAKRVEEMGAGLIQNPEQPPQNLAAMLRQVLADPSFRANAGAFAAKYANFDQNAVMTHIVARIEELADPVTTRANAGVRP